MRKMIIEKNLVGMICETKKDFEVLNELQEIAMKETSFNYAFPPEQKAIILFDSEKEKYLGFLVWMRDWMDDEEGLSGGEVLQQIFIIREARKKGFATKLLKFWVETFADKTNRKFGVETDPMSPILIVLEKAGYLVKRDEEATKCYFVESI